MEHEDYVATAELLWVGLKISAIVGVPIAIIAALLRLFGVIQ
jgi:hypothetical protein